MLSACATVYRTTLPASECFTTMVDATGLRAPTPHAELPTEGTAGAWVDFGNRESGRLDEANADRRAIVGIGETCERWQKEAVKKAEKGPWWKLW